MKHKNITRIECDECRTDYYIQDGVEAPRLTLLVESIYCMDRDEKQQYIHVSGQQERHFCSYECIIDYCTKILSAEKVLIDANIKKNTIPDDVFNERFPLNINADEITERLRDTVDESSTAEAIKIETEFNQKIEDSINKPHILGRELYDECSNDEDLRNKK